MENQNHEETSYDRSGGCLLRLFWMIIGNALLLFCLLAILERHLRVLGIADAIFWITVGCLLVVRYADIRYFHGVTADGGPSSMAHWRRYAMFLCGISLVLWLAVHAVTLYL